MDFVIDVQKDFQGDQDQKDFIANLNSACEQSYLSGFRFTAAKVARLTVGPWLGALGYARPSFECVGLAAPQIVSSHARLRSGPTSAEQEQMHAQLIRYELYPEKVKNTPIAKAAAEVCANRASNATHDKQLICTKAAQLLNLLPQMAEGIRVESGDHDAQRLAIDSARLVWGPEVSQDALNISSTLFQARDLLLAQQKKDSSMAAYLRTMPPANLNELVERVSGQQSDLRASNETWLQNKAGKLKGKCDALVKSADAFCSSLAKLVTKRDEWWSQRRGWTTATASNVKTRWENAWAAFRVNLLLVRNGREEAPKRKSVEVRYQDLEALKSAIVVAKTKLESKCKQLCVETASLSSVLRSHATDWLAVEEAMRQSQYIRVSFSVDSEAEYRVDDDDASVAMAVDLQFVDGADIVSAPPVSAPVPAVRLSAPNRQRKGKAAAPAASKFSEFDLPPTPPRLIAGGGASVAH